MGWRGDLLLAGGRYFNRICSSLRLIYAQYISSVVVRNPARSCFVNEPDATLLYTLCGAAGVCKWWGRQGDGRQSSDIPCMRS